MSLFKTKKNISDEQNKVRRISISEFHDGKSVSLADSAKS